jgi:hypothetical protein
VRIRNVLVLVTRRVAQLAEVIFAVEYDKYLPAGAGNSA